MGKLALIGAILAGLHGGHAHAQPTRLSMVVAKETVLLNAQLDRPRSARIDWCVRENARTIYCEYTEYQPAVGGVAINGRVVHWTVARWDATVVLRGSRLTLSSDDLRRSYRYALSQVATFARYRKPAVS